MAKAKIVALVGEAAVRQALADDLLALGEDDEWLDGQLALDQDVFRVEGVRPVVGHLQRVGESYPAYHMFRYEDLFAAGSDEFERLAPPGRIAALKAIKRALDPNGLMNPGKVLPPV